MIDKISLYAQVIIDKRIEQDHVFGAPLRGTLAWDLLLVMFVADANCFKLTKRLVAERAQVNYEICRRWMAYLASKNLVIDKYPQDPGAAISLHPIAISKMEEYILGCIKSGKRFYLA